MAAPILALALAFALASILLASPPILAADLAADDGRGGGESSGTGGSVFGAEWEVLTKKNFSSQIRVHRHVLLMVTLPWSGESRSLRNKLSHLVNSKSEELDYLRLMVVYKNAEKMLANLLHTGEEETTIFYYHYSIPYRYNGRLSPQNILSSIFYVESLKLNEVPFKTLETQEDLESYFLSTDKAILLLDFCGWSSKLLQRNNGRRYGTSLSSQNRSENVNILGQGLGGGDEVIDEYYAKNDKQDVNVEQTCQVKYGLAHSPWFQEFTTQNKSAVAEVENQSSANAISCASNDFLLFESFFTNFTAISREYLLPPERHKFGLISEKSLLSFLGVDSLNGWSILLHNSGCPSCSSLVHKVDVVHKVDDLRNILSTQHSLVMELTDGHNIDPAFPASRPSVILFVDRSSESAKVREESKSSLEVLKKFASNNNNQQVGVGGTIGALPRTWMTTTSVGYSHQARNDFLNPKTTKLRDNLGYVIINEGESVSRKITYSETQDSSIYDMLTQLINKKRSSLKTEVAKLSMVAKDVGFELLSDDFEVQMLDSLPLERGNEETNDATSSTLAVDYTSSADRSSQHSAELNHVNMDITGLLDATEIKDNKNDEDELGFDNLRRDQSEASDEVETYLPFKSTEVDLKESGIHACHESNSICFEKDPPSEKKTPMNQENTIDLSLSVGFDALSSPDVSTTSLKFSADNDMISIRSPMEIKNSDEMQYQHHPFQGSFFFSDGGYRLLHTLTAEIKIPSLVILDPVLQQHYVLSQGTNISYSSLVSFIDKFLNGSLIPYRRSVSSIKASREIPRPPFVNMDFHEADSIPQVTRSTFCELVVGYKGCETGIGVPFSKSEELSSSWKTSTLVLFSSSGCGFCQRMELILREVYRAFKNFMNSSNSQFRNGDIGKMREKNGESSVNELPLTYIIDCTHNDCGSILKPLGKEEEYPTLLLFPAENKSVVSYEGDMSVVKIMEFLELQESIPQYLSEIKGILWNPQKVNKNEYEPTLADPDTFESATEKSKIVLETNTVSNSNIHHESINLVAGSVLVATDKLSEAAPFDSSTILVVTMDQNVGFHGVIINKPINWNIFQKLDKDLECLKHAPLSYGGPVTLQEMPLVSLARKDKEHYTRVIDGVYFGNPVATRLSLKRIKSGIEFCDEYWFFFGYSSWSYDQLYHELMEGAWQLSSSPIENLDWPKARNLESESADTESYDA